MKQYKSARKLDSLPVGSVVKFGEAYGWNRWEKTERGWVLRGDTFSKLHPYTAEALIHWERGRGYNIATEGESE